MGDFYFIKLPEDGNSFSKLAVNVFYFSIKKDVFSYTELSIHRSGMDRKYVGRLFIWMRDFMMKTGGAYIRFI